MSGLATNPRDGDLTATGDLFLVDSGDVAIPADAAAAVALDLLAPNNLGRIRALGYIKVPKGDGSRALHARCSEHPELDDPVDHA